MKGINNIFSRIDRTGDMGRHLDMGLEDAGIIRRLWHAVSQYGIPAIVNIPGVMQVEKEACATLKAFANIFQFRNLSGGLVAYYPAVF